MGEVQTFVADNREALGTTSDKLAGVTAGADRQPRRCQAVPARGAQHVAELRQHLATRPGRGEQRADDRTTSPIRSPSCAALFRRRPGWAPSSRRSCACNTWRRSSRTGSTTSCPLGAERLRRRHGAAQRADLQRGLDATGLHSAAAATGAAAAGIGAAAPAAARGPPLACRGACRHQSGRRPARA